jgi:hypothetical protein
MDADPPGIRRDPSIGGLLRRRLLLDLFGYVEQDRKGPSPALATCRWMPLASRSRCWISATVPSLRGLPRGYRDFSRGGFRAMELGYHLSSEEHGPNVLVENARRAEEAGFAYGVVSDHFHPWIDAQGQCPLCVVRPGRYRPRDHPASRRDRGHLSPVPDAPEPGRPGGGDGGHHVRGPLLPRSGS